METTIIHASPIIGAQTFIGVLNCDDQSAGSPAEAAQGREKQRAGAAGLAAATRCVHARLHDDAEKAELRAAQGVQGEIDPRLRSDFLYRR